MSILFSPANLQISFLLKLFELSFLLLATQGVLINTYRCGRTLIWPGFLSHLRFLIHKNFRHNLITKVLIGLYSA